jgi:hypothetical protein
MTKIIAGTIVSAGNGRAGIALGEGAELRAGAVEVFGNGEDGIVVMPQQAATDTSRARPFLKHLSEAVWRVVTGITAKSLTKLFGL